MYRFVTPIGCWESKCRYQLPAPSDAHKYALSPVTQDTHILKYIYGQPLPQCVVVSQQSAPLQSKPWQKSAL
jgi:hypothetical protein